MICPSCGARVRSSETICPSCGRVVYLSAPDDDRPAPRARREPRFDAPARPERPKGRLSRKERALAAPGSAYTRRRRSVTPKFIAIMLFMIVFVLGGLWIFQMLRPRQVEDESVGNAALDLPGIAVGTTKDGKPAHILTFYGTDGDILYIEEMKKNYTFLSGQLTVEVPDALFIGQELQENTIEVTLHPMLYADNARPRALNEVVYTIDIPPAPLEIVSPAGGQTSVYTSMYLIQLKVEPGSRVLIGEEDVSDLINSENVISHNVPILPVGDNAFEIQVETPGFKRTYDTVTVSRPHMDIDLEIAIDAPVTSTSGSFSISGKCEPGAAITVEPAPTEPVEVEADGSFTIKMSVSRYGANRLSITASKPGREDSVIDHTVLYTPNLDEYSAKAWGMDYPHLVQNQTSFQGRIFKCTGKLERVISETPYVFTFDVGTGGEEQLLVIELVKEDRKYTLDPNIVYDIYADLEGEYEGMPRLNGRFLFEAEIPEE